MLESGQATIAWSEGPVELRGESDCLCLCLSVSLSLFFVCVGESRAPAQRRGEEGEGVLCVWRPRSAPSPGLSALYYAAKETGRNKLIGSIEVRSDPVGTSLRSGRNRTAGAQVFRVNFKFPLKLVRWNCAAPGRRCSRGRHGARDVCAVAQRAHCPS